MNAQWCCVAVLVSTTACTASGRCSLTPIATASVAMAAFAAVDPPGVLVVDVKGLRNDRGHAMATLYDRAEGFPNARRSACRWTNVVVADRSARLVFADLEPGTYAVGVIHDENDNGRMDRGLFGLPKEGFGLSGYDEVRFEIPKFERAAFQFGGGRQLVTVKVHYLR